MYFLMPFNILSVGHWTLKILGVVMHAGDAGLAITVADTHADSAFLGAICVEKGYKHRAFVHPSAKTVRGMTDYMHASEYHSLCVALF